MKSTPMIALFSVALCSCSSALVSKGRIDTAMSLRIESASVVRVDRSYTDLKILVSTLNGGNEEYCELSPYFGGKAHPPQSYFVFLDSAG